MAKFDPTKLTPLNRSPKMITITIDYVSKTEAVTNSVKIRSQAASGKIGEM